MNLYYIKLTAILIVILSCIIATYTDIRYQIIPNKLTFTTGIIGLLLGVYYYVNVGYILLAGYFINILLVYIFSYILWHLGLWAGGDVKLFTSLSTLLLRDYLDIIPSFNISSIAFPAYLYGISPIYDLMFNSMLSVIPLILLIIIYEILKNKIYLIKDVMNVLSLNDVIITFNSLMLFTLFDNFINLYLLVDILILLVISYANRRISKIDNKIPLVISIVLLIATVECNLLELYIVELISILVIYVIRAIVMSGILFKALRSYVHIDDLEESMVLAYNLCYNGSKYYFDNRSIKERLLDKDADEVVISTNASGLDLDEIVYIRKLYCEGLLSDNHVLTKKTLSFGPFILAGLVLTLTVGDVYLFILHLGGMVV